MFAYDDLANDTTRYLMSSARVIVLGKPVTRGIYCKYLQLPQVEPLEKSHV